ncbi:unnamed protein product [Danaus chrysippus]|uniref:(African queen) hypothetical protein n=1 Tax=Danaus chrysippus TaxID=151541 RepID=A0A8J2QSU6_9NEOP|nr:unnamed protein product [Danaus chrysippus]
MFWLFVLFISVRGLDLQDRLERADSICRSYGYQVVEGIFGQETYLLCLKTQAIGTSPLMSQQTTLLLDPDMDVKMVPKFSPALADIVMSRGFPVDDPAAGSAEGYVGEDNHFYGVLHLGNRTLHADPYGKDGPDKSFGVLINDNMAAPKRPRRDHAQVGAGFDKLSYFPYHIEDRAPETGVARARICDLLLLADKEFYEKDANSSINHVVQRMMHAVAQADIIFRNSDFNEDGVPDNIGFAVKYILILTSDETNNRVFGDLVKDRSIDGRNYLMRFARLRRLSEVCLGVAFSGHAFLNRTLGLSFTSLGGGLGGAAGGLCDRRAYGRSFNTLALAHATGDRDRVPERLAALTLAHEMGHSFGAHHDDHFPNPDCRGYLMGSQSAPTKHSEFSVCSKRLITATLSSMSYCLTEVDQPYCGNGIVEIGESCDCGLPSECSQRDPCCTPRAGGALVHEEGTLYKDGCSVSPGVSCHPSQGLCCNANCEFANLTSSGIDCHHQHHECTCADLSSCDCGVSGKCLLDGTCQASDCALLGLKECKCPKSGPGGTLKKYRKCGVCCQFTKSGETKCQANITLKICVKSICGYMTVRAWSPGEACVSLNTVGVCSPKGNCKMLGSTPSTNIYPEIAVSLWGLEIS